MSIPIHAVDLTVFLGYLLIVVALGVWVGRGQKTVTQYFLGDRNLPWWALLGSIVATETSTVTFLSVPGISFAEGGDLRFLQLTIGYIAGRILISLFMLPMYFRGKLHSAYQILGNRFGPLAQKSASIVFLLARNFGDALRLFLTALVLQQMFGTSIYVSIVVLGLLTIFYTLLGGMKAVVWNDCIQLLVYLAGGILMAILIVNRLPDGITQVWEFGNATGRFRLFDFAFDLSNAFSFWAGLVGGLFLSLGTHGVDQMLVQRYLAARSQRDASLALVTSGFVVCLQFAFFLVLGVGLACYTDTFAPNMAEAEKIANDGAVASFIVNELPAGLGIVGFILAGVFSAAMSTLSSSLNSSASVVANDFLRTKAADERSLMIASRFLTAVFGLIQIGIAIVASQVSNSVVSEVLGIAGMTIGAILGLFALANLRFRISELAAVSGLINGMLVLIYIKFETDIAWPWYALLGSSATILFGCIFEVIRRNSKKVTT